MLSPSFGIPEVVLYFVSIEQFLEIVLVALPVIEIVVGVEVELLVLGLVLVEGAVLHLSQAL